MKQAQLYLATAALLVTSVQAADLSDLDDAKILSNAAMELIVEGKVEDAFALLAPNWPLPQNELAALTMSTIQQRNLVESRFGKSLGYQLVREENLSDFAVRYTFAELRQVHVVRWQFIFYRPEALWKVNSVVWDDNIGLLFQCDRSGR